MNKHEYPEDNEVKTGERFRQSLIVTYGPANLDILPHNIEQIHLSLMSIFLKRSRIGAASPGP